MENIKKEFCLSITFDCNWNCSYCVADTHNNNITIKDVLDNIKHIEHGSEVTITGGEPGLVNESDMELIFQKLREKECKIDITTNGLFIKKYQKYYNEIESYLYHCSDKLLDLEIYDDPDNKIEYMIVIDDLNINNLDSFLENAPIYIRLDAAYSLMNGKSSLSKKNILNIIKKYKTYIKPEHIKHLTSAYNDLVSAMMLK